MSDAKSKTVSRTQAVNLVLNAIPVGRDAIKTQDQLANQIEKIVVDSGGKADLKATGRILIKTLKVAEELGVLAIHRQVAVERVK